MLLFEQGIPANQAALASLVMKPEQLGMCVQNSLDSICVHVSQKSLMYCFADAI